jgi:hypothetical protein
VCEEQPGAVSVRRFFESFKPLTPFDYENSGPTSKPASGVHEGKDLGPQQTDMDPANISAYEVEDISTGSSDSLTASDGEFTKRPHQQLRADKKPETRAVREPLIQPATSHPESLPVDRPYSPPQ